MIQSLFSAPVKRNLGYPPAAAGGTDMVGPSAKRLTKLFQNPGIEKLTGECAGDLRGSGKLALKRTMGESYTPISLISQLVLLAAGFLREGKVLVSRHFVSAGAESRMT